MKNEKDKWNSGMKNDYFTSEDIFNAVYELFDKKGWLKIKL